VAGKRVKAFKKRHDAEPDARIGRSNDEEGDNDEGDDNESEHDTDGTGGEIIIDI
jgi:hypothetical protein